MSRHVVSEMNFGEDTFEFKDQIARSALNNLNSFEYAICDRAENTPLGVSFTSTSSGATIEGTVAASANTKYKIYLVPSGSSDSRNTYHEYITIEETVLVNEVETSEYRWEKIGTTDVQLSAMTGATASTAGSSGLVPAPSAGDADKVLKGDGTWGDAGADLSIVTDEYDATATYPNVGSYCVHDGVLYRSTAAITTAEAWTAAHWTATTVSDELRAVTAIQPAAGVYF